MSADVKKRSNTKLVWLGAAAAAVILPFAGCYAGSRVTYSEGYRDGTVQKLSEKGLVNKTVEGEMVLGGMEFQEGGSGGGTLNRQSFAFSVTDPEVKQALEALPPGKKVRLHYRQMLFRWGPSGETRYFVTRVEEH